MSDFVAFSDEITEGMNFLEHHGILNQKWGHRNGPPYPLGSGDHSKAERGAAKAAGIKVGKSSGKGSIEKVSINRGSSSKSPAKPKKAMTDEEKRQAALDAVKVGDKKKIAKYMDYLTTEELRDAQNRAQMKDSLTKEDPQQKKASKAEMEKREAMLSGDKEKVKQYADQMTTQELQDAMNKVVLTQQLNYVEPPKSAMDKLSEVAAKVDQFRSAAEKGINAYNLAAKVYNSTHKDSQWPIINLNPQQQKEKSAEQNAAEAVFKKMSNDMVQNAQQAKQQNQEKSYKEQAKEARENALIDYKEQKKLQKQIDKLEAKEAKKAEKKAAKEAEQTKQEETPKSTERENVNDDDVRTTAARQAQTFKNTKYDDDGDVNRADYKDKTWDMTFEEAAKVKMNNPEKSDSWRNTWNSVEEATKSSRPISDDLTPAEEEFLESFRRR